MDTIGDRIRAVRIESDLTQLDIARAAGITKAAVSALERGSSKNPRPETLLAVADRLAVEVKWLVAGSGRKWRNQGLAETGRISEPAPSYYRREQIKKLIETVDESKLDELWNSLVPDGEQTDTSPTSSQKLKSA